MGAPCCDTGGPHVKKHCGRCPVSAGGRTRWPAGGLLMGMSVSPSKPKSVSTSSYFCGTGWFTRRLADADLLVTGLDIDTEALDYARTHSPQNVSYLAGDGRSLPFTDRSFEQTVAITSLCFIDDWPRAIGEIVRVTRSRFVLGLLNRRSLLWRRKGRDGGTGGYAGAHWHTRRELAPVFAGLKVRQVRIQTAVFIPTGTTVARLVESFLPAWLPWGALLIVSGEVT